MKDLTGRSTQISLSQIEIGKRARKEFKDEDLLDLGADIANNGLINPITVLDKRASNIEIGEEPHRPYYLLAGERRYKSIRKWLADFHQTANGEEPPLHMKKPACRVFNWALSEQEIKIIELHENTKRKQFTPQERALLTAEIHEALTEIQFKEGRENHTARATAKFLGVTEGSVSQDIKLAKALRGDDTILKEKLERATDKNKALKLINARKKELVAKELSRRIAVRKEQGIVDRKQKVCESYVCTTFEDGISEIPERSIDFVELDPDYGIGFSDSGAGKGRGLTEEDYVEIAPEDYRKTLTAYCDDIWRVMKDNSWGVVWFSIRWYKETYDTLTEQGFYVAELPIFWDKVEGNTSTPAYLLNNQMEFLFYIRKGKPQLATMGASNLISTRRPHQNERFHPAEKPIEFYEKLYPIFARPGSRILVGFAGSGNAILAAHNLGYPVIGFDCVENNKAKFDTKVLAWKGGPYKTYDSDVPF